MFDFLGSPVRVRPDLRYAYRALWGHLARPGPILTGEQRILMIAAARTASAAEAAASLGLGITLGELADRIYHHPATVDGTLVRAAGDEVGDPATVEVIALVSMLSAVDSTHTALGSRLEPLPEPQAGPPSGEVVAGLQRRRHHIPAPPGPIPVVLDLLPSEGAAFQSLFGPQYMTDREMDLADFARRPGLDRAQMELVATRVSLRNECFY